MNYNVAKLDELFKPLFGDTITYTTIKYGVIEVHVLNQES
jgi:hypothetical protein